jgi:hypothetical protein
MLPNIILLSDSVVISGFTEFKNNINLLITSMLEMLKLAQLVAMDIQ